MSSFRIFQSDQIPCCDLNPLRYFFMMNELTWRHETNWTATEIAPQPPSPPCLESHARLTPDSIDSYSSYSAYTTHTANFLKLQLRWCRNTPHKAIESCLRSDCRVWPFFFFFFSLLVYRVMLLEGLCCHLVFIWPLIIFTDKCSLTMTKVIWMIFKRATPECHSTECI